MARSELSGYLYEKSGDSYVDVYFAESHRLTERCLTIALGAQQSEITASTTKDANDIV